MSFHVVSLPGLFPEHEGRGCSLARLRCTSGLRNCLRAGALTGVTDPLITAGYPRGFTLSLRTSFAYDRFRRYPAVGSSDLNGVTTRKCSECTTSWTKHERAARWYVRSTLDGCRSGGGRSHVSDVPRAYVYRASPEPPQSTLNRPSRPRRRIVGSTGERSFAQRELAAHADWSSCAFASFRSAVSKPSVNQP